MALPEVEGMLVWEREVGYGGTILYDYDDDDETRTCTRWIAIYRGVHERAANGTGQSRGGADGRPSFRGKDGVVVWFQGGTLIEQHRLCSSNMITVALFFFAPCR